jgi:hypothetical protein
MSAEEQALATLVDLFYTCDEASADLENLGPNLGSPLKLIVASLKENLETVSDLTDRTVTILSKEIEDRVK